jgi:hypothetical protein
MIPRARVDSVLRSPSTVYAACAISLALGLLFIFVIPPHPYGWKGIDQYHELARALARGEAFPTTDVPWGYAYYVAAFYALFGEVLWAPLVGQAFVNALAPLLAYRLVRYLADERTAVLTALLVGVLSFNTVYASTQSSDAICTVAFLAMLLFFIEGALIGRARDFVISGVLAGIVPQFRPNLILFPFVLGGAYVLWPGLFQPGGVLSSGDSRSGARKARRYAGAAIFLALAVAGLAPWTIRNYRLTGTFLPTSSHGAVQLWYGTLQVASYLENRADNPRTAFEPAAFDYTSLGNQPIVISLALRRCESGDPGTTQWVYWTDRDGTRRTITPVADRTGALVAELPGQPDPTTIYYYVDHRWRDADGEHQQSTPPGGADDPGVYFVGTDHLGDLDRHGDLLDAADVIRMVRAIAWRETIPPNSSTDFDGDGVVTKADLRFAVRALVGETPLPIDRDDNGARMRLTDGSTFEVPRASSGKITDITVTGQAGTILAYMHKTVPTARVDAGLAAAPHITEACRLIDRIDINQVYYRRELHQMRRYSALAWDNIQRRPIAFGFASIYRMARLFVIRGTDDKDTAQQFGTGTAVYAAGTLLSSLYLAIFFAGAWVAWRRRSALRLLLLPIVYVPLTISVVLTNMRYTITVQPFLFAFVAYAVVTWIDRRQTSGPPGN